MLSSKMSYLFLLTRFSLVIIITSYSYTSCLVEAERKKREEAERKAWLDELAEKQRQREKELEEKERIRKEALLGRSTELSPRLVEPAFGAARPSEPVAAATAVGVAATPPRGRIYDFQVDKFLKKQFIAIDRKAVLFEKLADLCMSAVPGLSFTHLACAFHGGFAVGNDCEKKIYRRGEMESDLLCELIEIGSSVIR